MPLNLFYTMVQKSQKWPKTQIKGGPALSTWSLFIDCISGDKALINIGRATSINPRRFGVTRPTHDWSQTLLKSLWCLKVCLACESQSILLVGVTRHILKRGWGCSPTRRGTRHSGGTTTEEEHSSSKSLEKNIPELFSVCTKANGHWPFHLKPPDFSALRQLALVNQWKFSPQCDLVVCSGNSCYALRFTA